MNSSGYFNPLTNRQQDICSYGGVIGILLSLTSLVQLMIYGTSYWVVPVLMGIYLFVAVSFLLLALQKPVATILLIISAVLLLFAEFFWIRSRSFSPVVLLLFLYAGIAVVFLYTERIPAALQQKQAALRAEEEEWEGKI